MHPISREGLVSRVSSETRRLLATVMLSLAALWILARIRFPERPATPDPVAPVLSQIAPRAAFDDLARSLADVQPDIAPLLAVVPTTRPGAHPGESQRAEVAALRFRQDAVLALVDAPAQPVLEAGSSPARDAATGLVVARTPVSADAPVLRLWSAARTPETPRYLLATGVSRGQVYLRPVFFGPLQAVRSAAWDGDVWSVPPHVELAPGCVLWSLGGALVGVVSGAAGGPVVVPAETLIAAAERLLAEGARAPGWLGVGVQALNDPVRAASGAASGVVVTWVSPDGPAAGRLRATDVVESVGGKGVSSPADWLASVARLPAGEPVTMRVRRAGASVEVLLSATAPPLPPAMDRLGLSLRRRSPLGAEVVRVEDGSLAMRVGLRPGDVVTQVGETAAPTPAQLQQALAARDRAGVLLAVSRGSEHLVLVAGAP